MANVLISAMPYGHASLPITLQVVEATRSMSSSGDAANVLISLVSQRLVKPSDPRGTLAVIERTLTMESSGDRANVLISLAGSGVVVKRAGQRRFHQGCAGASLGRRQGQRPGVGREGVSAHVAGQIKNRIYEC